MAERRMVSKKIVDSDLFIDMSLSGQVLYFHFLMRADDEGFIGNPKTIMRVIGCNEDDYKILLAKKFVIAFQSGICAIRHWYIHNYIQKDRFTNSQYTEEKALLRITKDRVYISVDEDCTQTVYKLDTKVRKGQDSSVKNSKKKEKEKISLPSWLELDTWNDWLEYLEEKGRSPSDATIRSQLAFLEKDIENHEEIILKSIQNSWSGLFPMSDY